MRRMVYLIITFSVLLMVISTIPTIAMNNNSFTEPRASTTPYAVMFVGNGTVQVDEAFNVTIMIYNPTIYNFANTTFYLEFPVKANFLGNYTNYSTEFSYDYTAEDTVNVTVKIPFIPLNSTYILNIMIRFREPGTYSIKASDIETIKKKGEYESKIKILLNHEIVVSVLEEKESPYPQEGTIDATWIILLLTVIAPLVLITFAHKIAWKSA